MKLTKVQVRLFRNILDSTEVLINDHVTCLVGKNESGKTAFLHALYSLNPARQNVSISVPGQYPAWREKKDRQKGMDLDTIRPIRVVFELDSEDLKVIEDKFGKGVIKSDSITIEREYSGKEWFTFDFNEAKAISNLIKKLDIPSINKDKFKNLETFEDLIKTVKSLKNSDTENGEAVNLVTKIEKEVSNLLGGDDIRQALQNEVSTRVPKFFYYSVYSTLPARVKIKQLLNTDESKLSDDELTALSLLRQAATDEEYLLNPDYERRKRELENVANAITLDVLKYWTQNPELRVQIDISQENIKNAQGKIESVLDELKIRMWDERHWLSLPFDEHSTGFRWFFSFLAAFSQYEFAETPVIILLDEPALGLHARAQKDFLKFIDERLAPKHQVIHTTHSPFMIQPDKLERVRLVEDKGRDDGASVSQEFLSTDPDTLFPLQGALGYDLAQHLLIAPHNLIVEGTSDFTYLSVISDHLKSIDRIYLDDRWSIIPVGGADLIPTFVALLGIHLDVTVLIDSRKSGNQRLLQLAKEGSLSGKRIIPVGEVIARKLADIEDIFTVSDYLNLYNRAFGRSISLDQLTGTDKIISRISRYEGVESFDHGRPADELLRHRDEILPNLSGDTLMRFEKLFERINMTLPID